MNNAEKKKLMTMEFLSIAYDHGHRNGMAKGFELGVTTGFVAGVQSLQTALSCGLRHGSPEYGRAMEALKRLKIDREQGDEA